MRPLQTVHRETGVESYLGHVKRPCYLSREDHGRKIMDRAQRTDVDKKNQLDVTFCIFISLLIVAQHVSGNHVPIIRS